MKQKRFWLCVAMVMAIFWSVASSAGQALFSPQTQVIKQKVKKKWMIMFAFRHVIMDGNLIGSRTVSPPVIFAQGFQVVPLRARQQMVAMQLSYMLNKKIALILFAPYFAKSMDIVGRMGMTFTTNSSGFGDLRVLSRWTLEATMQEQLKFAAGLGLPTGSINKRDRTPMDASRVLGYPMQLGSGTVGLVLRGLYAKMLGEQFQWGLAANGVVRFGRNWRHYRLGDMGALMTWLGYFLSKRFNIYTALQGGMKGNVHGADPRMQPNFDQTENPNLQAGRRLWIVFGANLFGKSLSNGKPGITFGVAVPVYQYLDGPQLKAAWKLFFNGVIPLRA